MPPRLGPSIAGLRYGTENQLEVLGKSEVQDVALNILWDVKCHVCANDPELYGDAVFKLSRGNVNKRICPCGCSSHKNWTKEQYVVRIRRLCEKNGYTFNGFVGEWKGNFTKISLHCPKHSVSWDNTTIALFFDGTLCPICTHNNLHGSEEDLIEKFKVAGEWHEDAKFFPAPRLTRALPEMWSVECPVCIEDEYSKAGLCQGVFETSRTTLLAGQKPCRCSTNAKLTKAQQEFRIMRELDGTDLTFVGWAEDYCGGRTKFTLNCTEHGHRTVSVFSFLSNKHKCTRCANFGIQDSGPANFYLLKVAGMPGDFLGYGITINVEERLREHRRQMALHGYAIESVKTFKSSGLIIKKVERLVKRNFPINRQEIIGFKTEATFTSRYSEMVTFVEEAIAELEGSARVVEKPGDESKSTKPLTYEDSAATI